MKIKPAFFKLNSVENKMQLESESSRLQIRPNDSLDLSSIFMIFLISGSGDLKLSKNFFIFEMAWSRAF